VGPWLIPVQETIGNLTGSEDWKTTGQHDKDAAVKDMRAANEASGDQPGVGGARLGKVEESLGSAVGCEGMMSEGQHKQHTQ
jgi:uncharacterized protein YjbJ (UPF0337 family)